MIAAIERLSVRFTKRRSRRFAVELTRHAIVYATVNAIVFVGTPGAVDAATYYWDADGSTTGNNSTNGTGLGGNGIWNTTSMFWWDGTNPTTAWTNPNTAVFSGVGGVVTLGSPIVVDGLMFNCANVFINGNAGSNTLTLSNGAVITLNHASTDTIGAVLTGTNGLNLSSTAGGTLILTGVNTYLGTTSIDSGTLQIFSDAALGNVSNGITFTGASGGLSLYGPVVLGAGRTITLNNSAAVTLTSATNDPQGILGKVTGAGNLNIVNTGATYFFNSANDFTGTVWAQNGTLSLYSLSDASGAGNIKLGNAGSAATLQWASGAVGPLVLNNRKIELAGTTGGATFDSSSVNAANTITINGDVQFTSASSGNKTLTFTGVNTGTNSFAGSIFNNGTSTTAITKSSFNMWSLSGTASDYTGIITLSTGVLRINGPGGFGGAGNISFGSNANQILEIRSDSTPTGLRSVSNNSSTNQYIYVDRALGSTMTDQTITFGTIAQVNSTAGITFVGNHGYGVSLGQNILATAAATTFTITNDLGSPGLNGYTVGPNEMITIAGFTHSVANTVGSTQTINGWGNYVINGAITGLGTQALNITKSGLGMLTFAPTSVSAWTSGTLSLNGGITRFVGQPATSGATVTFNGGVAEFRNDTSTVYQTGLTFGTNASTLVIDRTLTPATGSGAMITFGAVTGNNTSTLNIIGDHGYSLTTGTVTVNGTKTLTLANYLSTPGYAGYTPGTVTLGNITTDATAGAGTLVLAGYGDFTIGSLTSGAAGTALNLTKSNLGVMTFNTAMPGWTSTTQGVLTTTLGTTRIDASVANVIGGTSVGVGGGLTELRNNASTTWANGLVLQTGSGTLVVAPQINASASTVGNTFTFGSFTSATTGLTMIVDTNHQYGLTISGVATSNPVAVVATTISNIGNGTITLAGGITSTLAASTYTFTGPGDFNITGNITQSGAGTTAITKTGLGLLTISGTNSFNGALTMTGGGVTRITSAAGLGGTGTISFNGANANAIGVSALDLRNDAGIDISQRTFPAGVYNVLFNVDRSVGGSGTNKTMMIGGGLIAGNNGWGQAIIGANGYSLQFGSASSATTFNVAAATSSTISNFLPSVSGNGAVVFYNGISFVNGGASTLALAGTGDFTVAGPITNTGATAAATINKTGTGTLTLSGNNSTSFNVAANSIITMAAGITRVATNTALGGVNTTLNLNGAALDLRSDSALIFGTASVTIGTVRSTINVDRAVGGTGTGANHVINSVRDNGVFTLFTTGGTQSGGNAYGLTINTFTVAGINTAAIPTLVNSIGNGGLLSIGTLTGAATFNTFINGSGNTNITSALTLATATLTKSGSGTLTISGNAGGLNTNGGVSVNGGSLVLDYSTGAATNILQTGSLLTLAQGTLLVKGAATGTTMQTLGNVTPNAGQDNLAVNANGGSGTTLKLGTLAATTAGSTVLISQPSGATITTSTPLNVVTAQGRNVVLFDGTDYNWAANTGADTAMTSAAYTALATTGANDTLNSQLIGGATTVMGASRTTNSLMINANSAGGSLDLSTFTLTLNQGGLLFTGSENYTISSANTTSGLKSAIGVASDTVVNHYGTGVLTITAPILTGTGVTTFTYGGTGKAIIGNAGLLAVGTYAGTTFVNGGTLQLASSVARLGNANTTALTLNGGTLDLNGNALNVGAFSAGIAGTIDNTSATAAIFIIGNGNGTGTSNGVIKNTGAALSVTKAGTGAITLGDAITGGSNQFTGDLSIAGASTLTINSLADSAAKINFAVSGATLTYVSRNNLVLDNRTIDISAAGASATISSNSAIGSINGTNAVMTINSNLAPTGSGTLSLTLGGGAGNIANGGTGTSAGNGPSGISGSGNVAIVNSFNGNISNGTGGGTLGLTISGAGGWALTGNNTYGGGTTISSTGLVRAGSSTAFGTGTVNVSGAAAILDLRSDSNLSFTNAFQINASFTINVDRAVGGSAYGGLMTLAQLNEQTTGRTVTVSNLAGVGNQLGSSNNVVAYGLSIGALNLNVGAATTIANGLGSPGSTTFVVPEATGGGTPGALTINSIAAAGGLTSHLLTISSGSNTNGTTILNGDITQGSGTALALTYTGNGTLTLANQTIATNYSGGLTINTAGGVVRATNQYGLGTGTISIGNTATLEVRNDASVTYANGITLISTTAAAGRLNVGEAINGTGGHNNLFTFGTLTYQGVAGNGLTIGGVGNSNNTSGNSVVFTGVVLNGFSGVVTNNLLMPGFLTLGTITNTAAGTQTLSIAGSGLSIIGDANNGSAGGFTGITYSGTGILDLTRATAANTYTGGLTVAGGTTRIINAFGLGGSGNTLIFGGGALELRSDTNVTISNPLSLTGSSSLYIGQTAGGTGPSTGIMYNFGTLKANVAAKTLTILGLAGTGAASSDSVTIANVDLNGLAGATTVANNLPLPTVVNIGNITSSVAQASALSFAASGSGVMTITGNVTDGAASAVGLAYTGSGILDMSRMTSASTYTGGFTLNGTGIARVTDPAAFGASSTGISLLNGTLEIRTDTTFNYLRPVTWNATNSVAFNVGELGTGTTTGVGSAINFGQLTITTAAAKVLTVTGIGGSATSSGDSVSFAGVNFGSGNFSNQITNALGLPGALNLGAITGNAATAGSATLTIAGTGFTTATDISNGSAGGTAAITYSGSGLLQITPTATATTNYSGGLNLTGTGILRVITNGTATNFGASTNVLALTNGTLDVRADANLVVPNTMTIATNNVTINADQIGNGVVSKTITFNGAATTLNTTAKALIFTSGSNYNLAFTNGFNIQTSGYTITNSSSGSVSLGALVYNVATSGTFTLNGSGLTMSTGNISNSAAGTVALTYGGTGFLDLSGNNASSNGMTALSLTGAGGIVRVGAAVNLGIANAPVTINTTGTAATLQVRSDNGSTSNGTIAFGNPITFNGSASTLAIIDVGNAGSTTVTGNTAAFGLLNNGGSTNIGTLTINGANGYKASFTGLTLPNSTGQTTNIIANAPTTIGNVTNAMATFGATNFDTLVLDGVSTGTIAGTIIDGVGGSITAGGLTRITKQGTGTWILNPGVAGNAYIGVTTVTNGTLQSGANNAISSAAGQGLSITASAGTATNRVTAIVDLAGFNQTLSQGAGAASGTLNSALQMGGGSGFSQAILTNSTGTSTLTLAGTTGTNGDVYVPGTNGPLRSIISVTNLNFGTAARTFNIGTTAGDTVGLQISSSITSGTQSFIKTGAGVLQLTSPTGNIGGLVDIQNGTVSTAYGFADTAATSVRLGLTTVASTLQWIGTGGFTWSNRQLVLNGTTAGGTLDASAANGSGAITINTAIGFANGTAGKTLTLTGANTDNNRLATIGNEGAFATAVTKSGVGTWVLGGASTYTGATNITGGTLRILGSLGNTAVTLNGTGVVLNLQGTNPLVAASTLTLTNGKVVFGNGVATPAFQTFTGSGVTGTVNGSFVGGASNGGSVLSNSILTFNIANGVTETFNGLIGGLGTFENNINLVKAGGGTLVLGGDLTNWTGSSLADPLRPTLSLNAGVLILNGTINTAITNFGGLLIDNSIHGPNFSLVTQGGLVSFDTATDTFASNNLVAASHGVASLNFNNTAIADFAGSDMYIGATGARILQSSTLVAGAANTYRFGGGSPWQAPSTATSPGSGGYLQISTVNLVTGSASVIIGDNGTYNGGAGIFGNLSSVEFTAPQDFSGGLKLLGGTFQFTAASLTSGLIGNPSVLGGSVLLDGGTGVTNNNGFNAILRYGPSTTTDVSAQLGIISGGTIDTGANNVTFASVLANFSSGTGGLNKIGTGTLVLNKQNTYAGPTGVTQGTLTLDLNAAAADNVVIGTSAGLILAGGNLTLVGSGGTTARSQTFTTTSFASGSSTFVPTLSAAGTGTPNLTLALGTLSRAGGATGNILFIAANNVTATNTLITQSSIATTNTLITDTNGVAYLTFGTTATSVRDWAVTDATTASKIVQAPAASFYVAATGTTISGNADIGANSPTVALAAGNTAITSIRFDNNVARTLTLNQTGTSTASIGGILVTSNVGNVTTTIAGTATLQGPNNGAGDLVVHNWDTSNSLVISSPIGGIGFTKSGPGTVSLTGTNTYGGQTVINGGILQMDNAARYGSTTGFTLNGGTFNWNVVNGNVPKVFTLGVNGGGINAIAAGNASFGTAGDVLQFLGTGSRSLNLTSVSDRRTDFLFIIGDNGGPTSLNINSLSGAGNQSVVRFSANNTYTGTTTITLGALELNNAGALPGGVGGATLTSANTGGGNLIFNGAGTNHAILGLSTLVGDFTRSLGTGLDQVYFLGNGGFGNMNGATTRIVNIGGAAATLTWGSTYFFPSNGILQFGHSGTNLQAGAIDFQNPLALGSVGRTIDVQDNGQSANTSGTDVTLSAPFSMASGGSLTKTGLGVMKLIADNSANTAGGSLTVSAGYVLFSNPTNPLLAIPGQGATNRNVTLGTNGGVVLAGATPGGTLDISALISRIASGSAGAVLLDTSTPSPTTVIDLSNSAVANVAFGVYSDLGGTPIVFGGTIIPNGTVYRFNSISTAAKGGQGPAATAITAAGNLLVLPRTNLISGAVSTVFNSGTYYLSSYNNYTGTTTVNGNANGATQMGFGNDSAFGSGALLLTGGTAYFGSLNGDHSLSNNIVLTGTGNYVVAGDTASRGITNRGAFSYLGTITLNATIALFSEGGMDAVFFGDLKPSGATTAITFNNNGGGLYSLLTQPAGAVNKTFTSSVINAASDIIVIDSDRSLGTVPASPATNITVSTGAGMLQVQPGTAAVTLSVNRNIVQSSNIGVQFNTPGSTISIGGVATGGLVGNSTLTIPGIISGGGTGLISKLGIGTLVLQGVNTATMTHAQGFQVFAGTLQLDYANFLGTAGTQQIFNATPAMLTLGTSGNGTLSNGGTLLISNGALANTQNFTALTFTSKDNAITLNSSGGVITLGLGAITASTTGGTLNFTGTGLSTAVINSTFTAVNGILPAATWNGADLVAAGGTALSRYTNYQTLVTSTNIVNDTTKNVKLDGSSTGDTQQAAGTTDINTFTFTDTAARNLNVGAGNTLRFGTVGMILGGSGTGGLTIGISGSAGTLSAGGTVANTAGEIVFINNSTNPMILNSTVANNGTGAATVVKSGSGVLRVTAASTYTGATYVNAGVLEFSDGGASKNFGNPTVAAANIVMNGGALRYTGTVSNTLIYGTTFNTFSAIDVPNTTAGNALTMGTATASSGTTGILGVPGILRKTGAGTLTLGGTITNANLSVQVVAGTLNLNKTSTATVFAVDNAANAALIIESGASAVITGTAGNQISDTSSVIVKGTGVLDLGGGAVTSESIDGLAGDGIVTNLGLIGTFTLTIGANNSANISEYTLAAATAGLSTTGLNNFFGTIQDGGAGKLVALTKAGAGTQTFSAALSYSGNTTITAGTLKFGTPNALPSGTGKGDVNLVGNTVVGLITVPGTLDLSGYNLAINGLNSTTGGYIVNTPTLSHDGTSWGTTVGGTFSTVAASGTNTLTVGNNNASGSFNGILQDGLTIVPVPGTGSSTSVVGFLSFTKIGTGTQVLSGVNTATGLLTVNQGELDLNTSGANAWLGNVIVNTTAGTGTLKLLAANQLADTATVTVAGGTFNLNTFNEAIAALSLTNDGIVSGSGSVLTAATNFDLQSGSVSAVLAGAVGVNKTTAGTVVLSGANLYLGVTAITAGTLQVDGSTAAASQVNVGTAGTLSGSGTVNGDATLTGNGIINFTSSGLIGGALGVTGGNWSGLGTVTGAVSSTSGTFTIGSGANLTASSGVGINASTLSGPGTVTGNATLAGSGVIDFTSGGLITGTLSVSGGTWNGVGSVNGVVTSSSGTFTIAPGANLTSAGGLNVTGGTLVGTGTVTADVSYSSTSNSTFAGEIAGSGRTLTVNAPGATLTLTGTNNYTGTTTVSGGTLLAAPGAIAASASITINSTGNFFSEGIVAGPVTVSSGGSISAGIDSADTGPSAGEMEIQSSGSALTWLGGSTIRFQFSTNDQGTAGLDWSHFNLPNGHLALLADGSNPSSKIKIDITALATNDSTVPGVTAAGATHFDPDNQTSAYHWLFVTNFSSIDTTGSTNFTDINDLFTFDASKVYSQNPTTAPLLGSFYITTSGNDMYLNYAAVPEPGSLTLIGVAGLGLAYNRRRKNRRRAKPETAREV